MCLVCGFNVCGLLCVDCLVAWDLVVVVFCLFDICSFDIGGLCVGVFVCLGSLSGVLAITGWCGLLVMIGY